MTEITFATFNTQLGLRAGLHRWAAYDVASVCDSLSADVLVLQEVWRDEETGSIIDELATAGYFTAELPLAAVHRVEGHRPRSGRGGGGTVGLAVVSRFPIAGRAAVPLGRVIGDPMKARSALHVELDVDGTTIDVVTVHTSSRLPYGPVVHLRNLRSELPGGDRPAIVAGDCNIWGPVVARLLPEWRRAVIAKTWPSHWPHSQIDHILTNRHVTALAGDAIPHEGSDHRPVRARLQLASSNGD
jgi:endonuclease/exonuclease/phosphatase family metal-dependent hydrolase